MGSSSAEREVNLCPEYLLIGRDLEMVTVVSQEELILFKPLLYMKYLKFFFFCFIYYYFLRPGRATYPTSVCQMLGLQLCATHIQVSFLFFGKELF
jgi:hypothetical protein